MPRLRLFFALVLSLVQIQSYRLPDLYVPTFYELDLNLPPEAFTNTSDTFQGRVSIQFLVTNATSFVALHAHHDFVQVQRVVFNDTEVLTGNYSVDNTTDILNVSLPVEIDSSVSYSLVIEYTGRLSTRDMYGLYKSYYLDANGTVRYLVTTQFEATYARRAFPCFDEPALKAVFGLSVTVPNELNVLFNTKQTSNVTNETTGLTSIVFNTTPLMPTYLLALVVSDFTCTSGASIGNTTYQVCSRNESAATRQLALDLGPQLLAALNNFTGYDYGVAMEKMDQVAIPDFAAGAMENWGLVTYRETAILWDINESSNRYRQRVATVIAHEFAHQWFGDLVTPKWWSEIFLNEGFATYFEFFTTHEVLPSWQLDKQFVIEELHAALLDDSLENAHALQSSCSTPAEISSKFSTISYSKGGSVLRMVEHVMQLQNFRTGLQNYLTTYQFSNTEPENLWDILNQNVVNSVSRLPANLTTVMENWTKSSGYPVLDVDWNGNQVTISQKRFLISGEVRSGDWYVPISYTVSSDLNKFHNTTPNAWLVPSSNLTITLPSNTEWIILNNHQTGFYRVNYGNNLWNRIRNALTGTNFDGITEINRAHIVDDLFNLARAGQVFYPAVLDTVSYLVNETSYFPWYSALSGFSFLLKRVGEESLLGQTISSNILRLMSALYDSVPISTLRDDDVIYTHTQTLALAWACKLGKADCVWDVKDLFSQYQSSGIKPNKNLRSVVYCNALRYSNNNRTDWEFLWNSYLNSTGLATEQITVLSALGCTRDVILLREYLNKTITDGSGIRPQDALSVFVSVYSGSPEGVDVAFEFLMGNYITIATKYAGFNSLGKLITGLAQTFTTQDQIARLRNFIMSNNLPEDFQVAAGQALEIAETNARWLQTYQNDLWNYYNLPASGSDRVNLSLLLLLGTAILVLSFYK
ncbi:hypothetical protein NQ315_003105 [Exocentrus adspersus]|uniref:Aminopeptidase n=1 Tax=Exocentrus adspersus TaxID=1586481 RepID=A0AAV8W5Q5_9CUCU|nr:hypothetical protein NQ315_003105 [Exocentrus adspersus]